MTEELGHGPKRGALHDQPRGEGVPQVMPREVFDLCGLECRVKRVLDVFDRLAGLATRRVREHVRTVRQCARCRAPVVSSSTVAFRGTACGRPLLVRGIRTTRFRKSTWSHRRWNRLPRRRPVCTDRMIFSARNGDVSIVFAACKSRLYSSSVRYRSRELSSLKNLTRQTGFDAARLRAMHQLKNAFKTARSLSTVRVSHILGASQFDVFDERGRNLREQRARLDVCFPHGERGLDIRVV